VAAIQIFLLKTGSNPCSTGIDSGREELLSVAINLFEGACQSQRGCKSCILGIAITKEISQFAWTPTAHHNQERETMNPQNAMSIGNRYVSDNGQEREQTLQKEATGKRIDEIGTGKSTSPAHIPHHSSCCCISCWSKNMNAYL
jgi:hypothetical protein